MYGYNPMYPQSPFMPPSRGRLFQPRQMIGYEQKEPSFGSKLARLGLQGVSSGVGQMAKDSFIEHMKEEEEPKKESATGGAGEAVGSAGGAALGSYLLPGAGTIIGGLAGGLVGGVVDSFFEEEKEPVYQAPPPPPRPRLDRYANRYSQPSMVGMYGVQGPYGMV